MKVQLCLLALLLSACIWVEPEIQDSNESPIIDIAGSGVNLVVGAEHQLDASNSYDPEGGELEFLWVVRDPNDDMTSTREVAFEFEPKVVGVYVFQLRATDAESAFVRTEFTIRVTNADPVPAVRNCVPGAKYWNFDVDSLTAIGDIESVCLNLDESYDPDGHEIDWTWKIDSVPVGGEAARVYGEQTMRLMLPVVGTYEGRVNFSDPYGGAHEMQLLFVREN